MGNEQGGRGNLTYSTVLIKSDSGLLIANKDDGQTLFMNLDLTTTVYINTEQTFDVGARNTIALAPLDSITLDPVDDLYALCSSGQQALMQIIPRGSFWFPASQLAAQVTLDQPQSLFSGPVTVPAGVDATIKLGPFNTAAFKSWFALLTPPTVVNATPFVEFEVFWTVDQAGLNSVQDFGYVIDTNKNNITNYFGHGPMWSPYMWVQFSNYSTTSQTIANLQIWGTQRDYSDTTLRSEPGANTISTTDDDILLNWDTTVAANSTTASLRVGYYAGPVTIRLGVYGSNAVNSTQLLFDFEPKTVDFAGDSSMIFIGPLSTTGQNYDNVQTVYFPKRPVSASIFNGATVSVNTRVRVIAGLTHLNS